MFRKLIFILATFFNYGWFSEKSMKHIRFRYSSNYKGGIKMNPKLPDYCYSTLLTTGETILIKKGESGYYKTIQQKPADELNALIGVTKAEAEAMYAGSMFGWGTSAANPDNYDENGKPKLE